MKKAIAIYTAIFALTVIIPALICFKDSGGQSDELVNIFKSNIDFVQDIIQVGCCR